ncbi:UPF0711 protein C18orf21 homolog [Anolis carolinensis]|uniref:CR021 protein n=1 Tax=Anolis carolinensis TaxID=28377 RepID=G1KFS9_ANOCA|nr:PREDICTED: UPF0711 protein C18orf21 homolog [Anolis carolinensis]|eukprot:XP_003222293.1 PREDICTED: UPF0711 protein C18orf21 homolog [Anolis carolinensis]
MGRHHFLELAAQQLAQTCPGQARFLRWTLSNIEGKKQENAGRVCVFCYQLLLPGNYRVRLMPKIKITPRIEKLLYRERKNYRLNLKQTKILKKYKESTNVLLITCNVCGKTARHKGSSRRTSWNKTTPASRSQPGSKRETPFSSPRISTSGQSTPGSSSRTPKNAKAHFTQLKRLLCLEEEKQTNKKGLKSFLLSL